MGRAIRLGDIELPAKINRDLGNLGSIRVFGKERKERTITLNWKVCKAVKSYQAVRFKVDEDDHLFIT
jgi:site-specific recombinase XerC